MIAVLRTIAIRLALCGLVTWIAWRQAGATSAVSTIILYGVALAKPLIDLASELRHLYRRAHWRDREGRHYVFRRIPLMVHEDADHRRWIGLAAVRQIVGFTASDASLRITYPHGFRLIGRPPEPYLSDDALIEHLKKERAADALRFRHWAEREIAFPARRLRERYGVRSVPEPFDDPEGGGLGTRAQGFTESTRFDVAATPTMPSDRDGAGPSHDATERGSTPAPPSEPTARKSSSAAPARGSVPPTPSSKTRR